MSHVLRKRLSGGWTGIPNATIRDRAVSFRATGLLAYVLSLPDGSTFDSAGLSARKGQEGRDAVRAAMRELRAAGYARLIRRKAASGGLVTDLEVSDVPVPEWTVMTPVPLGLETSNGKTAGHTGDGFSGACPPQGTGFSAPENPSVKALDPSYEDPPTPHEPDSPSTPRPGHPRYGQSDPPGTVRPREWHREPPVTDEDRCRALARIRALRGGRPDP